MKSCNSSLGIFFYLSTTRAISALRVLLKAKTYRRHRNVILVMSLFGLKCPFWVINDHTSHRTTYCIINCTRSLSNCDSGVIEMHEMTELLEGYENRNVHGCRQLIVD
jgi:hypothetical protein